MISFEVSPRHALELKGLVQAALTRQLNYMPVTSDGDTIRDAKIRDLREILQALNKSLVRHVK